MQFYACFSALWELASGTKHEMWLMKTSCMPDHREQEKIFENEGKSHSLMEME